MCVYYKSVDVEIDDDNTRIGIWNVDWSEWILSSGIRTPDLCDAGAVLYQLSY